MLLQTSSGGFISVDTDVGLAVVATRRTAVPLSMRTIFGVNQGVV